MIATSVLDSATLLETWERARPCGPLERALLLLEAAEPVAEMDALAEMPIGERDRRLLALRDRLFGSRVNSLTDCPACGSRVELDFDVAQVMVEPGAALPLPIREVAMDGYAASFRLPCSRDLAAAVAAPDTADARLHLLQRCVVGVSRDGEVIEVAELPIAVVEAIPTEMADADPQADVRLGLTCPDCGHTWEAGYDIGTFLWSEVDAWAWRTLREVDVLARAYGWNETTILQLSATRRRLYIELAAG